MMVLLIAGAGYTGKTLLARGWWKNTAGPASPSTI